MNIIPSLSQQPEPSLRRAVLGWLMRVANRHPLHLWYDNKAILLEFYGEADGFDLQTVEATCWRCAGDGCDECEWDGVHHTTRTVLRRRRVGGCIFHTPGKRWFVEDFAQWQASPGFHQHISRRIQHRPCDHRAAREAVGLIMLLTGHYRQWWRTLNRGTAFEQRTVCFPTTRPGLYPQHLLACALHHLRCEPQDVPF